MVKDPMTLEVGKMKVDINYSKASTPCKKVRFTLDGKVQEIDRKELYTLLFICGDNKQQEDMIPVTKRKMRMIRRMIHIRANKDIKKGELMTFPYTYAVSEEDAEQLLKDNPRQFSHAGLSTPQDVTQIKHEVIE